MFQIEAYGDRGIRVQLGDTISGETNEKVRSLSMLLDHEKIEGVMEWIPAYTAISIYYDPYYVSFLQLKEKLIEIKETFSQVTPPPAEVVEIPVCYGGNFGSDLEMVANHNGLTEKEVIDLHAGRDYLIYMMGFTPGFPYLGGMSEKIAAPRLPEPRAEIQSGSVGIAGSQTGIYPMKTPGGWRLIGRTPVKLYQPDRKPHILLKAGNYIRFIPISLEEYNEIEAQVSNDDYTPIIKSL